MPQPHSVSVVPRRTSSAQRRLAAAICLAILILMAAIGLIGAMTVQSLAERSTTHAVIAASPVTAHSIVGASGAAARTPLIIAV